MRPLDVRDGDRTDRWKARKSYVKYVTTEKIQIEHHTRITCYKKEWWNDHPEALAVDYIQSPYLWEVNKRARPERRNELTITKSPKTDWITRHVTLATLVASESSS